MKVCPQCQASFEEGYVYCPHDETQLQQYDLRAALRRRQQQELNLLLPALSFPQRLQRELGFAAKELRRHPLLFLRELLRGEGNPRQRLYLLQSGAAVAVMAYAFVVVALVLWGVAYGIPTKQVDAAPKPPPFDETVKLIMPVMPRPKTEAARASNGHLGGSLPEPQKAKGGGSSGQNELTPASQGARPHALLKDQVVLPDVHPPKISDAKLIVTPHVFADPKLVKATLGQLGLSDAPIAPPSAGKGKGGSIGNEQGTGVGNKGNGPGFGNGRDGNTGGDARRDGGGDPTGTGDREGIPMASGSMRPTILYREKARYTEEARRQKIQGSVILLATFTADGRLTNIRVLKGLPEGLTQEAIKAAQHIRFNPATRNGAAVTVQARLEYNFSLY
jgi:TonB family protein